MESKNKHNWKTKLHEIIYEADTPKGKLFDVILLVAILASVILVMLESVKSFDQKYQRLLLPRDALQRCNQTSFDGHTNTDIQAPYLSAHTN